MSLISMAKGLMELNRTANLYALYQTDTTGYKYLKENSPHLISQLDSLTMEWTLIPKVVVRDIGSLENMLETYKENLELSALNPDSVPLPSGVSFPLYKKRMEKLFKFLEEEVKPVLQEMPIDVEEVKEDVATEFIEDDFSGDESGDDREETGEASSIKEQAED